MINGTCVGLAFLCTGLGAVGIVLPFLPTTPFFLVAAALFAKGSKRFHRWFTGTALYRRHLEPFVESKTMTMKKKLSVLAMVTALLTTGFIMSPIWHARVVIVVVALAHYYAFFFRIKTEPGTPRSEAADGEGCAADESEISRGAAEFPACGCSAEDGGTAGQGGCGEPVSEPGDDMTPVQSAGDPEISQDPERLPACGCSAEGSRPAAHDRYGEPAPGSGDDMTPVQSADRRPAAGGVIPSDDREVPQCEGSRYSGVSGTAENDRAPADTGHARIREAAGGEGWMPRGSAGCHRERRSEKGEENVS